MRKRWTRLSAVASPTMPPPTIAMSAIPFLSMEMVLRALLEFLRQKVAVHAGHVLHVVADAMVLGGLVDVRERFFLVPQELVINADVEMGVKKLLVERGRFRI